MKKRVFLILFMFLTTLVLAGCDWFGQKITTTTSGSETTVSVTTSVTTNAPTTTVTTTVPVTTVTTVTTNPSNITISFEENGGSAVSNISQASGTAVTAPTAPSRTGYTFVGWYSNTELTTAYTFTTMPSSNITLYAKWQVITYTVNFYDEDETLITTQTVQYGQNAIPPTTPYKAGVRFVGWDTAFNNVTGNLTVTAVYEQHYELLVQMIFAIGGEEMSTEEVDEMIELLMFVSNMETEEETYLMLSDVMELVNEIPSMTSLLDFQTWFASLSTKGFDRDTMVQMLTSAVLVFIDVKANEYDEQRYLDEIADLEASLANANAELLAQKQAMTNYCLTLPTENQTVCKNYLEAEYLNQSLQDAYHDALYPSKGFDNNSKLDWTPYYDMEYYLDMYYLYLYEFEDPTEADLYYTWFEDVYDNLTAEEFSVFDPLLTMFRAWKEHQYIVFQELMSMVNNMSDPNHEGYSVGSYLQNEYMPNFWNAYYAVDNYTWIIEEQYQRMAEGEAEHEILLQFRDYLWTVDGTAKLTTLAGTVYDVAASVIVGIDESVFNMIFGLITGSIDPEIIPMTPTDISGYAHKIADLLTLISSTLNAADAENILALGHDLLEIYLSFTDMPTEQQTMILNLVNVKGPQYFGILSDVYGEIINILNSMTPEKVEAIMAFVDGMNQIEVMRGETEQDRFGIVIQVAKLVDILLYDGSVNTDMLVGHFITVYFDITTMFNADPTLVALVKAAMIDAVDQMIALSHEVALIDPENASVDDMLKIYELYKRGERLVMIFESEDLPSILEPYDYLEARQMMINLIDPYHDMGEEQVNALIDVIMTTFDYDSEAQVMFTIMQVMNLQEFITTIDSVEAVQELYQTIGLMGFDNATIAGMAARFLEAFSNYMVLYEYDPDAYDLYYSLYMQAKAEYDNLQMQLTAMMDAFNYEIEFMPEPQKTDINNQWNMFLNNRDLENDFWNNYYFYSNEIYYMEWNYSDYWYLDDILNRYYQTIGGNMLPPEMRVENYQVFLDELAFFSPEEISMYQSVLYYAEINYNFHWTVYMPSFKNIQMNYMISQVSTGQPVPMWFVDTINSYNELNNLIGQAGQTMDQYRYSMEDAGEGMAWVYIDEFFDDPENVGLVEDVALIMLDEVGSLIMYEDTDTYNLVIGLMTGAIDPSTLDFSPEGILAYINAGEDFLVHLFSTMDEMDKETVLTFANKVVYYYLTTLEMTTEERETLYLLIEPKISFYFEGLFDVKDIITNFMATMTTEKIQTVMDAIEVLNSLPYEYFEGEEALELNDNFVRAIYISTIISTLLADDTLDTDYLIELVINGYFDFSYGFMYEGTIVVDDLVLELQTLIDDIISQAEEVQSYSIYIDENMTITFDDPATVEIVEGMTQEEIDEIDVLRVLIENLMYFLDNGPEEVYFPTV